MPESMVILTVDDHPLIRSALRELLSTMAPTVELLEAADPEAGLKFVRQRPDIDLAFLDLTFPRQDGLSYIKMFRAAAPAVPLIVYTMHDDPSTLREALALGAAGIIPKTHRRELLQPAIELVLAGGVYLPPELGRRLVPSAPQWTPAATLTQQQRRILTLLAQGHPNKEIARRLGIATSTVKSQLTVVFERLNVSNRTQAAIVARALPKEDSRPLTQ